MRSTSCAFSLFLVCALENGENGEKREKAVKGFQWMGMSAELFFIPQSSRSMPTANADRVASMLKTSTCERLPMATVGSVVVRRCSPGTFREKKRRALGGAYLVDDVPADVLERHCRQKILKHRIVDEFSGTNVADWDRHGSFFLIGACRRRTPRGYDGSDGRHRKDLVEMCR